MFASTFPPFWNMELKLNSLDGFLIRMKVLYDFKVAINIDVL